MPAEAERLFVGRKDELAEWLRVLATPRGQAVVVVGQPGMGKTLLVNEMARLAREHLGADGAGDGACVRCRIHGAACRADSAEAIRDGEFAG